MSSNDVDPFLLEVLKNGLDTIADEMALVLMKTAYSGIVRDSMDFSTAVCDAEGQTLAQGLTTAMHLGSFYDAMRCLITTQAGNIFPGRCLHLQRSVRRGGPASSGHLHHQADLLRGAAGRVGDDDRASLRCRRHRPGLERARRRRDLPGRHPHPDREIHGARQAGRAGLADRRAQRAAARSADGRPAGADGGVHGVRAQHDRSVPPLRARNDDRLFRPPARLRRAAGARGDSRYPGRHLRIHRPHRRARQEAGADRVEGQGHRRGRRRDDRLDRIVRAGEGRHQFAAPVHQGLRLHGDALDHDGRRAELLRLHPRHQGGGA